MQYFIKLLLHIKEFLKTDKVKNSYVILLLFLLLNHLLTVLVHLEVSFELEVSFYTYKYIQTLALFSNQSEQFLPGCVGHFCFNEEPFIYCDEKVYEWSLLISKLMKHGSSFTDFKAIGDLKSYFSLLISTHCFSDYVNFVLRGTSIGLRYKTQKQ